MRDEHRQGRRHDKEGKHRFQTCAHLLSANPSKHLQAKQRASLLFDRSRIFMSTSTHPMTSVWVWSSAAGGIAATLGHEYDRGPETRECHTGDGHVGIVKMMDEKGVGTNCTGEGEYQQQGRGT